MSLLRDAPVRGWEVRFRECVQFYGYVRVALRLSRAAGARVEQVGIREDARVRSGSFEIRPLDETSCEVTIELLTHDADCFESLPIDLATAVAPSGSEVFEFTPAEAALFQYTEEERANPCRAEFFRLLSERPDGCVLEIGSRARSGVSRRQEFGDRPYIGLDVLPGEGVSVVGDVHSLRALVPRQSIDFVFSASVFEHLIMPWKVALEMNWVMRTGAVALIVTHQACGVHDAPSDFWRFSDTAWSGLFNSKTGFEIVSARLSVPTFIVPFHRLPSFKGFEAAAGYYQSAVLVRKTEEADPHLRWEVSDAEVSRAPYPA